jgi:hypothetical protein
MTLSPDIYAAQMLLQQIRSRIDQDESDEAEAQALTGPLNDLLHLKWPSCSEQQFLQLLELLGSAVYTASAGAAAATAPGGQLMLSYTGSAARAATETGAGSGSNGNRSQAMELQQLSEALVGGCWQKANELKPTPCIVGWGSGGVICKQRGEGCWQTIVSYGEVMGEGFNMLGGVRAQSCFFPNVGC